MEAVKTVTNQSSSLIRVDQLIGEYLGFSRRHAKRICEYNGLKPGRLVAPLESVQIQLVEPLPLKEGSIKVFQEEDFLVFQKLLPAHMEHIQGKENSSIESFLNQINPSYRLCQRLDYETLGLFLVAKSDAILEEFRQLFREKRIQKTYEAKLEVLPKQKFPFVFQGYHRVIRHLPLRVKVETASSIGSQFFEMKIEACPVFGFGESAVRITTCFGFPHIVRASMASLGCPLKRDQAYGAQEEGSFFLLASGISFPYGGENWSFQIV